jgi:hypothetical protein
MANRVAELLCLGTHCNNSFQTKYFQQIRVQCFRVLHYYDRTVEKGILARYAIIVPNICLQLMRLY